MCDVVKECKVCKQPIKIVSIYDIHDVARVQTLYYHTNCLKEYAPKRVKQAKHAAVWDDVVKNIAPFEKDAQEVIYKRFWQDKLDAHLKKYYDVQIVANAFWEIVADLHHGMYKRQSCKPVHMDTLYHAWVWSQKNLDSINRKNKKNNKGPRSDIERLPYDLAIVVQHIPDYLRAKAKIEAAEAERKEKAKSATRIDYKKIYVAPKKVEGLDDISDLLDEF